MQIPLIEILTFPAGELNILIGGNRIQQTLVFIQSTEFFERKVMNAVQLSCVFTLFPERKSHFVKHLLILMEN